MPHSVPMQNQEAITHVNTFVRSVYNWMAAGLAVTGVVAYLFAHNANLFQLMFQVVGNQMKPTMLFYGAIIAELALVFSISARVQRMQASTATALFIAYAALNGATLSSIFIIFTQIAKIFKHVFTI